MGNITKEELKAAEKFADYCRDKIKDHLGMYDSVYLIAHLYIHQEFLDGCIEDYKIMCEMDKKPKEAVDGAAEEEPEVNLD